MSTQVDEKAGGWGESDRYTVGTPPAARATDTRAVSADDTLT